MYQSVLFKKRQVDGMTSLAIVRCYGASYLAPSPDGTTLVRWQSTDPAAVLAANVRQTSNGCLVWQGHLSKGYAEVRWRDEKGDRHEEYGHRLAYRLTHGPIPVGDHIHHNCKNPACVNPAHLVALLAVVHFSLRTGKPQHKSDCCGRGHPFNEANTKLKARGRRDCRICLAASDRKRRAERRLLKASS